METTLIVQDLPHTPAKAYETPDSKPRRPPTDRQQHVRVTRILTCFSSVHPFQMVGLLN